MVAYRYWRVRSSDTAIAGEYLGLATVRMNATPGGADEAAGRTTAASVVLAGYPSANAVDGNAATFWTTGPAAPPTNGHWISVDLASAIEIQELILRVRPDAFREDPLTFVLDVSSDNINWLQYATFPTQSAWVAGEERTFVVTAMPGFANPKIFQAFGYGVASGQGSSGTFQILTTQAGIYALASQSAQRLLANQIPVYVTAASQSSTGLFQVAINQAAVYALVKGFADRRDLRAWTFTQDDHDFYGVQLGSDITLVYDKLTEQWCQWHSPGYTYWRAADVTDWEGRNLACDPKSGAIWHIDPLNRLDAGTTPIVSKIHGYATHRMRENKSVYMAELAVSEGQPPSSIAEGVVGITLRTSDDNGQSFVSHGTIAGEGINEDITVRWYGLGLMKAPGRMFEIIDSGYARRIDGLDIEVAG